MFEIFSRFFKIFEEFIEFATKEYEIFEKTCPSPVPVDRNPSFS